MKIRTKILLGFLAIYVTGFYFLFDFLINDIRPRYLEAVEESLNDTVNLLAVLLETKIKNNALDTAHLQKIFTEVGSRSFKAKIYHVTKTHVDLNVYVTDRNGIVLFDSLGNNVGKNYANWNDVLRTLRGAYGARSSLVRAGDESSSSLFVAAPIYHNQKICGVITVIKSKDSVLRFINLAQRKLIFAGIFAGITLFALSILLFLIITRPIRQLSAYVKNLKTTDNLRLPRLGKNEINELGRAFADMKDELEGKKYIEHYIQTLTHELKSPLSTIKGAALLLQESMSEEQRNRFYANIINESERIEKIIQKMLELASLEGRQELKVIELIELKPLIDEIFESFAPQVQERRISIENMVAIGMNINGEKFLIRQAIANLVQNAISFTTDYIRIAAEVKEKFIHIKISDNGNGIPDYALDKIFNKFYSLPGNVTKRKSTGLGLAFVREVALLHHGHIAVVNNPDCGVMATFSLPLKNN